LSGVAALALASVGIRLAIIAFMSGVPPSIAQVLRLVPMPLDYRVFAFTLAVAAVTTMVFALVPALQASGVALTEVVRGPGSSRGRGSRLRSALVVTQVAVTIVLIITAVTIARSTASLGTMDLGFDTDGVTSITVRGGQHELVRPLA